ncbi:hypothetical protein MF271_19880 (plasmid) [Deinococcus sp. KNUC1210]|uniref:hypothetical protein n=1 Tax=Deinococcus sp. KNUC1210 TaxID=2917691 RepID=UPI001EF0B65E|nr:hypothetical protein [Deinococcus sp. KNUC1210]ULH17674.1 hypothetical protein MF271_19880 [Deinococcus sp. KNUC1210]
MILLLWTAALLTVVLTMHSQGVLLAFKTLQESADKEARPFHATAVHTGRVRRESTR